MRRTTGALGPAAALLDALRKLRDRGLTLVEVVAAFHRRRVLSLVERHLGLDKMTHEDSMESSRMALAALTTDDLLKRVKGMVGKADYTVPVPMRPERGYVSLVHLGHCLCLFPYFFISTRPPVHP
jgi:hypothetical protein